MTEIPPSGSDIPMPPSESPQAPPPPPAPPTPPAESQPAWPQQPAPAEWQQPSPQTVPGGEPPAKPRKTMVWWAFILGFVTPAVGTVLSLWLMSATPYVALSAFVGYGPILAVVVAFVVGLVKPDDVLRSFGVGGLVGVGVGVLITLLLFGACLVSIAGLNSPLPTGD